MIAPARVAAYDVVRAVSDGEADLPSALARARGPLKDERDRALAGEIATGTLRWQAAFDHVIAAFAGRPARRLDPEIRDILRISTFQLLHLDRVPASAVVDDAVDLTRRAGKRSAAPFVNALLRRVSRERGRLPLPRRPADSGDRDAALDYLSIALSHPRWLVGRWLDRYGFEAAEAWCTFDNAPAALTLRANRLRTTSAELGNALAKAGVRTRPGRFAPDALVVEDGNPLSTPLAKEGLFVVMDEASQLVALFVDARPGERILDACASPGGKTTAMAADMADRGAVVAADVRPKRVRLLADTVRASGATCVHMVQADAARTLPFAADAFDAVLIDAPCSGLGTIRRDPDIRWRRKEEDFPALKDLQRRILEAAAPAVRAGGRLVYATCSSEPEENEVVIDGFLQEHPEFRPVRPSGWPDPLAYLLDAAGRLRTLPFRDGLEAFFAASVVKSGDLR
jgi:16S rRNA (cytosine967-C5)-methyltransferase